jgi:hypothetical protein
MQRHYFAKGSAGGQLEFQLTSPAQCVATPYTLDGVVRVASQVPLPPGYSVRVRSLDTGFAEETFLDGEGKFAQEWKLAKDQTTPLEITLCDVAGREVGQFVVPVSCGVTTEGGGAALEPAWPQFAKLVRQCIHLAGDVAQRTGREREDLFAHVHAQERYAEQAFAVGDPKAYRECRENLERYQAYLGQLLDEGEKWSPARCLAIPARPASSGPVEDETLNSVAQADVDDAVRREHERFRGTLAAVWKEARGRGRSDIEVRLREIAGQANGLSQRVKQDPRAVRPLLAVLVRAVDRLAEELQLCLTAKSVEG